MSHATNVRPLYTIRLLIVQPTTITVKNAIKTSFFEYKFNSTKHKNYVKERRGRFNMRKLKPEDYRILFELMKNARISDRKLAKLLGTSQPTVSRKRAYLEKELIDGYTAVPKWEKLGYEIFAVTFFKTKSAVKTKERYLAARKKGESYLMSQPSVIMSGGCQGMGMDSFTLSFHKSYSDYDEWFRKLRLECGDLLDDAQSVLINLLGTELLKPLHLRYLAEANK